MTVSLGLTGDVMLGRKVDEAQRERPPSAVWGDCLPDLQALDGLLGNLECCVSARGEPWRRTDRTFHFRAHPDRALPALQAAGVDCCALANNHVLDYEVPAFEDTLDHLDDAGIAHAGAGPDEETAFAPATFAADDVSVAVVSLTDNTPEYAAGPDAPGTAHVEFDVDDAATREAVGEALDRAAATDPDLLVASLHWGPNMITDPPAAFRRFGRWLVDRGVDVVHGHSAHVFQGVEVYDGAPICYDTGDFVDDYAVDDALRNDRGFLFELALADGSPTHLDCHPVEIRERAVHHAPPDVAGWCRETLRERSAAFDTPFERRGEGLRVPLAD
jgi:poly-gamma-glutamate capsule biosynthesis protein CapA/YwtB (metallophosphatase superfamily)